MGRGGGRRGRREVGRRWYRCCSQMMRVMNHGRNEGLRWELDVGGGRRRFE